MIVATSLRSKNGAVLSPLEATMRHVRMFSSMSHRRSPPAEQIYMVKRFITSRIRYGSLGIFPITELED